MIYLILPLLIIITLCVNYWVVNYKDLKIKNQEKIINDLYDLTDNVKHPIFLLNKDNEIIYMNKAFKKEFKLTSKNIFNLIPEFKKKIFELNDKIYEKQEFSTDKEIRKIFLMDISDKYRIEKMRKEFSANVSHEIKTPLTTIIGYSELLVLGMVKEEQVKEIAKKIYFQSSELLELLENVIKISRLEEGNVNIEKDQINLNNLVEKEIQKREKLRLNIIKVNLKEEKNTLIFANKVMLKEIVHNLISNAIKYNTGDYINITIKNSYFSIENPAKDLSHEDIERMFERFYRAKNATENISGNGLGLSIVKHIINLNNWNINVIKTNIGIKVEVYF